MRNDKIGEVALNMEDGSYVDAVEQFLGRRMIHESISVFLIGDDGDYGYQLTNTLGAQEKLEVVGRSEAAMEQVMIQLNRCIPDVILFDVGLGVSKHLRTTQLIRNICSQAKLIAIMPDALPLHIQQARWCGFHGWVLKEQPLQELMTKITTLYECQDYTQQQYN